MCTKSYVGKGDTVVVLKAELKRRRLAVSGRKEVLVNRLRNHDMNTNAAMMIQKSWRRQMVNVYLRSKGGGLKARRECTNKKDFFTMELLSAIPHERFFSYKDESGTLYGFALISLLNLRLASSGCVKNPYTNEAMPREVIMLAEKSVRIGRALGYDVTTRPVLRGSKHGPISY